MDNIQSTSSFNMPWMNYTPEDIDIESHHETPPDIHGGGDRLLTATAREEIATRVR